MIMVTFLQKASSDVQAYILFLFKLMKQCIVCLKVSQILYWLWKLSMFWMSYTSRSSCWSVLCFQIMFLESSMHYGAMFYSNVCFLRIILTDLMYLFQVVFGTLSYSTGFVSFLSKLEQKCVGWHLMTSKCLICKQKMIGIVKINQDNHFKESSQCMRSRFQHDVKAVMRLTGKWPHNVLPSKWDAFRCKLWS